MPHDIPPRSGLGPTGEPRPLLSKSRYVSGLQCEKRLWLEVWRPELALRSAAQRAMLDGGTRVGECARLLHPGGVLVDETDFGAALARTRALLARPEVPALFEAAFLHEGVRVRADLLVRRPGGRFRLGEVKASTSVRDVYVDDLAVQRFVLEGAGLAVEGCDLVHLNGDYVRGHAGIHWPSCFRASDQSEAVAARVANVCARVEALHAALRAAGEPAVEPGAQCTKPYDCPFLAHCTRELPADWVGRLPQLSRRKRALLREMGAERIGAIPETFALSDVQRRVRAVLRGEAPRFGPALEAVLAQAGRPAAALDFETMTPAIPLYAGTRPYEKIPFQWSLHVARPGGEAHGSWEARSFLAAPGGDPRLPFAESLLAATEVLRPAEAPVLVYSSYEATVLNALAAAFPELASRLVRLRERLLDLHPIVRDHVYDPAFLGSFSLKRVAPALVPGLHYGDLDEVAEGMEASLAFERMARGEADPDEVPALRAALLDYCARDTLALARLYEALLAGASQGEETP